MTLGGSGAGSPLRALVSVVVERMCGQLSRGCGCHGSGTRGAVACGLIVVVCCEHGLERLNLPSEYPFPAHALPATVLLGY